MSSPLFGCGKCFVRSGHVGQFLTPKKGLDNFRQGICMAQHFLKSSALRDFSVGKVANMSEADCFKTFVEIRWNAFDCVICPECGTIDRHYFRRARKQWRCKHCDAYFSVTTGTPFEDHKLAFKQMLLGIALYLSSANGLSIHRLCRDMDVSLKTAQVFMGKLRESLYGNRNQEKLKGIIHMDGGHFGGRPRHGRVRKKSIGAIKAHVEEKLMAVKKGRRGRSLANQVRYKKRRIVINLRELYPQPEVGPKHKLGASKTIAVICMAENEANAISLAKTYIEPGALIMTDENPAYNPLSIWFDHKTVQHAIEFATIDGISDNHAESYFSRLRRYTLGVAHRIEPKYMADIANEMAWREDTRRKTMRERLDLLLGSVFRHGRSQWWRGYWQGTKRPGELLWITT